MKAFWIVLAIVAATLSLSAQTTRTIQWDPNPATDQVTFYTLTFDSTVFTVPPAIDTTCNCVFQAISVTSGSHQACVTATNAWGTSPATCLGFTANPAGKVGNVRIK